MEQNQNREPKSRRGFASMSAERQRTIASMGGRAAHEQGVAHQWDRQQAMEAGRKGGQASGRKRAEGRDSKEPVL